MVYNVLKGGGLTPYQRIQLISTTGTPVDIKFSVSHIITVLENSAFWGTIWHIHQTNPVTISGEYPKGLYHNPRTGPNGEFTGLIKQFETIDEKDLGIKVYNLCPISALEHFEKGTVYDF